jgi:AcrR family transcriptional regulator
MSQGRRRATTVSPAGSRRRRTADDARRAILAAAEKRLIEGGPDAIRVQVIARDLGITDPAIHYHFGSRDALVEALMRHAGRRLKERIAGSIRRWPKDSFDMRVLVDIIADTYGTRGYARLAAWMALSGWRARDSGMYGEMARAVHAVRERQARTAGVPAPELVDTLFTLALLNMVLFAEPIVGTAMRRSVGLGAGRDTATRFREWLVRVIEEHLTPRPAASASRRTRSSG